MILRIENNYTYVDFQDLKTEIKTLFLKRMHTELGVKENGYQFSHLYKIKKWDGITDFYDFDNNRFPTGLLDYVIEIAGDLQNNYSFSYELVDERPEEFITPDEVPTDIDLLDNKIGKITLRDYQRESVYKAIESHTGIVELSTGAGKCLHEGAHILTPNGYLTVRELFNKHNITLDDQEEVIEVQEPLINRYGKVEYTTHFTKNGVKPTKKITTERGIELINTYNHPLLVLEGGEFIWKRTDDLVVGDYLVSLQSKMFFGESRTSDKESIIRLTKKDTLTNVPLFIRTGTKEEQLTFIKSTLGIDEDNLFNTPIRKEFYSEEFTKQFQLLLSNIGVRSTRNEKELVTLTHQEHMLQRIVRIEEHKCIPTYDVCMPKTHSFIADTIVNHNTEVASGFIQQILPYLRKNEKILFITHSTEIFNQSAKRISERLNIPVGKIGGGKFNLEQVNVVMIQTLNASLKNPEEGVKLTPKENIWKKIVNEYKPQLEGKENKRQFLKLVIQGFTPKTKVDQNVKNELIKMYNENDTDSKVAMAFNSYTVKYQDVIKKKNTKAYEKYQKMRELVEDTVAWIGDEFHHAKSDTWYNNLLTFDNVVYKIGLTGSIDRDDPLLTRRLEALTGNVLTKVSNSYMIGEGLSAKPIINSIPIHSPTDIENERQYQVIYNKGIVENNFRNSLICKLAEKFYKNDDTILIIVNFVSHGETLKEELESLGVEVDFLHGQVDRNLREEYLENLKTGKSKVMIATSLIDEGVDIPNINVLILGAGGKSLRQVLQRIGRVLRKKTNGENIAKIFDFMDRTHPQLEKHYKERKSIYDLEGFEVNELTK